MPSPAQLTFSPTPHGTAAASPRRVASSHGEGSRSTLLALERALAAQDEELELAFTAFRDLARRQGGLRLPDAEWAELAGSLAVLSTPGGRATEPTVTGAAPALGTRC